MDAAELAPGSIFGVTFNLDDDAEVKQAETLRTCFHAAVRKTQAIIQSDLANRTTYIQGPSPFRGAAGPTRITGISLFEHCGLPLVRHYADFLSQFAQSELSDESMPFCGLEDNTAKNIWLGGLHPIRWWREGYFGQIRHLARMNRKDAIWQGANQETWFKEFGPALKGYLTELFCGRFVDRNGVRVAFDLDIDLSTLSQDLIQVAPQVAGAFVAILVEFLGDQAFQVPYYAPAILQANRDFREATSAENAATQSLTALKNAIRTTALTPDAAKKLRLPKHGPIAWGLVGQSPLVESDLGRMLMRRSGELDADLLRFGRQRTDLGEILDLVDANQSPLQKSFTCDKTGIIEQHLKCTFVKDAANQGVCARDQDTGRSDGKKIDYADLVGKLVSFGATTAAKGVRSLMGGMVRGVAVLSLDNEVLAEVVSAAASTLAKKVAEKVVYEWLTAYIGGSGDPDAKRAVLKRWADIHEFLIS